MTEKHLGRHRAAGRYNPLTEITSVVVDGAAPMAKRSALLAVSGGLVTAAAAATPAMAAPTDLAHQAASSAPAAAPAVVAPAAVTAPQTATKNVTQFGAISIKAVAKPKGPTPEQLAARARRAAQQAAERAAAQQAAERAAAAQRAAEQAAADRTTQAASRTTERTAPAPAPAPAGSSVLEIAKSLSGIPYLYGGTSPSTGFDCSGFTQYIFAQVGKSLPRTAEQQRQFATPVSDPQPGDLVFFGVPAYHMGIYAGNGMMYDSPRTGLSSGLREMWTRTDVSYGRV